MKDSQKQSIRERFETMFSKWDELISSDQDAKKICASCDVSKEDIWNFIKTLLEEELARQREEMVVKDLEKMLIEDNKRLRKSGCELAESAIYTVKEYDGLHRLSLAVSNWAKAVADEGGRGEVKALLQPTKDNGEGGLEDN